MLVRFEINQVQHIGRLSLEVDLDKNKLTCIVGKNGVGKTTLVRAIRNLSHADTFVKTAAQGIFYAGSGISYEFDGEFIRFAYDDDIKSLNCKTPISQAFRSLCAVELPMPDGGKR
jgi:ABC-type cobalamin/Fe3+-siderophores transport system ATPase subunit